MKKILSAIAIMALMIVFASCTNSRKDGGASLYEPDNGMIEDGTSSQFDYEFVNNWGDQFLGENYNRIVENQYVYTNKQQESYFSMDSFTASYSNLRRYINYQTKIPNDAVRTDELLNYFNYDFGGPENDEMFSISANLGSTPWNERTQLLTINIKAKETDQGNYTGNNIVFLIDVSGSMASTNKLNLIKAVFPKFLDALAPTDKISIVTYSNKIKILANGVYADEKEALKKVVNGLSATGGTAGADGLEKAYNVAKSNYIAGGNNRVIIASDGDFNIGRYSQDDLKELVENQLNSGIYLTTLGFGMGNYKDTTMETLAKYGNGGYAYIDNLDIFYVKPYFFHDFPLYGLFQRFSDFRKSGNQRIIFICSSRIFGEQYSVPVCHTDNHRRTNFREHHIVAAHASHHAFLFIVYHRFSASAAETVVTVPAI